MTETRQNGMTQVDLPHWLFGPSLTFSTENPPYTISAMGHFSCHHWPVKTRTFLAANKVFVLNRKLGPFPRSISPSVINVAPTCFGLRIHHREGPVHHFPQFTITWNKKNTVLLMGNYMAKSAACRGSEGTLVPPVVCTVKEKYGVILINVHNCFEVTC